MTSELQPHRQREQFPEMEMNPTFNVLDILESHFHVDEGNVANFRAEPRVHSDGTASTNYDELKAVKALDDTENAIYRRSRSPMDITCDDINHFTITPQSTTDIIASFGISIFVIVLTF